MLLSEPSAAFVSWDPAAALLRHPQALPVRAWVEPQAVQPCSATASDGSAGRSKGLVGALCGSLVVPAAYRQQRRRRRAFQGRDAARDGKEAVVFIDGEAGTTGLQVRERLEAHPHIRVLSLAGGLRRDEASRREALRAADAAVLCLPDEAAVAAVELCGDSDTIIVDASTVHRVADGWVYGFPEMSPDQRAAISASRRIANPGCYPTGFIALIRPLVDAGLIPKGSSTAVCAISGYSGGGKGLIEVYENSEHEPWGAYGFSLEHKHLAEMAKWTGLEQEPIFMPAVADFKQGMVVSVPLRLSELKTGTCLEDLHRALAKHYEGSQFVSVAPLNSKDTLERGVFMRPDALKDTNRLELFVFGNEVKGTVWLAARLDNLGKGASGACVQNLNLALGFEESAGLL